MKNNRKFELSLKFEDTPIFRGKELTFDMVKKSMKEIERKFA